MKQNILNSEKFFNKFFIFFFFYLIFEGALRKWFLVSLNVQIILIRDLAVIFVIMKGFLQKYYKLKSPLENSFFFITILILFWILLQISVNDLNPGVLIIGFRNWIVYFWLSILFYRVYENHLNLDNFIKIISFTLIPMSVLVYFQFSLPVEHIINIQPGGGRIFIVIDGLVRTTGTFTFTSGYAQYIAFVSPFVLYLLLDGQKKISNFKKIILLTSFIACIILSGSRELILASALVVVFAFFINNNNLNLIIKFILFAIIIFLVSLVFKEAIEAIIQRFEVAGKNQSLTERLFEMLLGEPNRYTRKTVWETFSLIGEGIGLGSNIAKIFTGRVFILGEYESTRIINEGGIMGVFFLVSKFIFSFYSIRKTLTIFKKYNEILPLYFSIFFVTQLLFRNITGQLTGHAFTALGLGFMIYFLNKNYNQKIKEIIIK